MALVHRFPRLRARTWAALFIVLAAAAFGGWIWLKDSSLVAVQQVSISGVSGGEAAPIEQALTQTAREMTTLNVDVGRLHRAVAVYPQIKQLRVTAHPLHRLNIDVVQRGAVAALAVGDLRTPVAADGTLLKGHASADGLPAVPATALPAGGRVTGGNAAVALAVVAAAPPAMRRHLDRIDVGPDGLEAQLRDGPRVLLGTGERPRAKWIATGRVLGDPNSAGADYIDVRLPERPAAGGFGDEVQPSG